MTLAPDADPMNESNYQVLRHDDCRIGPPVVTVVGDKLTLDEAHELRTRCRLAEPLGSSVAYTVEGSS